MNNYKIFYSKFVGIIAVDKNSKKIIYEEPKNYQKNIGGVQ